MFEFANPWMFALLPIPLLVHRFLPPYQEHSDSIRVPFFQRLVTLTGQQPGKGAVIPERRWFQKIWLPVSWVLLVTALAAPDWLGAPVEQTKSARDLMVAVDLSGSMAAEDFRSGDGRHISRLAAVKSILKEFSEQRAHDRLGLIVFGDAPYLQVPFTEDHRVWRALLDESDIGMAGQSTVFGDAIGLAIKLFEHSTTSNRVLIVLTDGNDTGSKVPPVEAARVAASKHIRIYTIAIGDPSTVGEEALDLEVIRSVGDISNGHFYQALNRGELERAYRDIARLEPETYETLSFRPRYTLFHYPLAVIVLGYLLFFVFMTWQSYATRRQGAHG